MATADADALHALLDDLAEDGVDLDADTPLADLLGSLGDLAAPDAGGDDAEADNAPAGDAEPADYADEAAAPSVPRILLTCRDAAQQEALLDAVDRLASGDRMTMAVVREVFTGVESRALTG